MLLALDFDGTLAPIVDHPDKAAVPQRTRHSLNALARKPGYRIAIVTGRAIADVKGRIGIDGLIYCGNQGLEIEIAGQTWTAPGAEQARGFVAEAGSAVAAALRGMRGILLENKRLSLSIHYRQASLEDKELCLRVCSEVLQPFLARRLAKVEHGKEVLEVQPAIQWDKGACLRHLANLTLPKAQPTGLCVYMGDDIFDEPAFCVAEELGGIGIFVGGRRPASAASYFLASAGDVATFLSRLVDIQVG